MTKKIPLAAALAAFAMACADPTSPASTLVGDVSLATSSTTTASPPVAFGSVELCKTSNVGGDFDFDATYTAGTALVSGTLDTDPDITIPAGGGTVCMTIYSGSTLPNRVSPVDPASTPQADQIVIVETANAVPLTNIDIIRYLHPDPLYDATVHLGDAFNVGSRSATVKINSDMSRRVTFTNTQAPTGTQGCTPGYWKQDQHFDSWNAPYDPTDDFDATFGVNFFNPDISLLAALNLNGGAGGKNQLARAAVAALLNAAEGFYPMTVAQVLAAVQGATPATYESVKNTLDTNNNLGCPLN